MPRIASFIATAIMLFFLVLPLTFGSWFTVDQTERGVVLRNGAIRSVAEPGLSFKAPWFDSVVRVPVTQQTLRWVGEDALQAYSADQQTASLNVSVMFHVPAGEVTDVYAQYGSLDNLATRLIARVVPQQLEVVFGRYTAVTAINDRAKLTAEVAKSIADNIHGPVIIDNVTLENIDFSDTYEASIEARMKAEVEVQKLRQEAEQAKVQAEITVTQAKAQADSQLAVASAKAQATKITGEAEAAAIKARGDALRENPGLVQLTAAERWDGKLPNSMVPNGAVPFISLEK